MLGSSWVGGSVFVFNVLGSLGVVLGSSWGPWESLWGRLGSSGGRFRIVFGAPGGVCELCRGRVWSRLNRFGVVVGSLMGPWECWHRFLGPGVR